MLQDSHPDEVVDEQIFERAAIHLLRSRRKELLVQFVDMEKHALRYGPKRGDVWLENPETGFKFEAEISENWSTWINLTNLFRFRQARPSTESDGCSEKEEIPEATSSITSSIVFPSQEILTIIETLDPRIILS